MSKNPVLPLFAKFLGADGVQLGMIAAASTIPGILVSLPAGSLSDLYGRRRIMLTSLLIFASAPFLYLFVTTPWQLMMVRFYHGFATAIFGPVANAAIAEKYPDRKGERISLFSSATLIGRSAAPFLGGFILLVSNYSSVYLAVGASSVCSLFVGILLLRDGQEDSIVRVNEGGGSRERLFKSLKVITTNPKILVISFVEAAQFFTFGAFEFFLILYADSVGLGILEIAVISGIQLVAVVVTKPIFGSLSDRFGRRPIIACGLLLGSTSLFLISTVSEFQSIMVMSLFYGLGFSAVTSSTTAYVSDLVEKDSYGSVMGFISTIMDVGQTVGPIVTGILIASLSYAISFMVLGLVLMVSWIVFILTTGMAGDGID